MRRSHLFTILLAIALAGGCAARNVNVGDDLSRFVGDRVSIEGVVSDMTTYVPGNASSEGWCLTLTRDLRAPRSEVSLNSGAAVVVFDTDRIADPPSLGDRVRVTGKLVRVLATGTSETQPTFAIEKAKWKSLRE